MYNYVTLSHNQTDVTRVETSC